MAIELHLQKTGKTSWGFRLTGGVEYEVPLTVIKVTEDSIAENAGMQEGDVIVRVNDIPMSGLTHPQAHDVLMSAGDDFVIAVRRGNLLGLPPQLLLYETNVESSDEIIKTEVYKTTDDNDLNITDEEIANIIGEQINISIQKETEANSMQIENTQSVESIQSLQVSEEMTREISEENIEISTTQKHSEITKILTEESSQSAQEKKWSTFLQKPKNPKPKPKPKEVEALKAAPYRVIIKKQPKKGEETIQKIIETIEDNTECNITDNEENKEIVQQEEEEEIRTDQEVSENAENQLDENENITSQCPDDEDSEVQKDGESELKDEDTEKENVENNEEESNINESERKLSASLELQLAQVQQQLLALSQLPSAIQQTLNSVTQQLAEIVSIKQAQEQETIIEAKATMEEEITEEYMEMSEQEETALLVLEEETSEHYDEYKEKEEQIKEEIIEINESEDEQVLFEALEKEIEEEERRKQEELEAQRIEQEKNEKKDKERQPSHPQTPLQRPIILPGGRRWSQPDDAISKIRRPSMTDEKIYSTINTFTEVVVGHTMGINFLKYQPPPKNLEYLQKSAVYRLVHDMEPPIKGIVTRDIKILAEQDYYAEQQEEKDLPAQMER